jgi:hypothetical protein
MNKNSEKIKLKNIKEDLTRLKKFWLEKALKNNGEDHANCMLKYWSFQEIYTSHFSEGEN